MGKFLLAGKHARNWFNAHSWSSHREARLVMRQNVIFYKINEITTTKSKWLITFVNDLKPLESFINMLTHDIEVAERICYDIL